MSELPVFSIPVPPHVRGFLLKQFGPDPWPIHQNQFMGVVVKMKVEKLPFRQLARRHETTAVDVRRSVRLTLPTALKHHTLTPESARAIGELLNKFFQQAMFMFVQGNALATGNDRAALRRFYNLYDIDPEHYDLEVGRKAYRDYKDNILKAGGHLVQLYHHPETLDSDYAKAS